MDPNAEFLYIHLIYHVQNTGQFFRSRRNKEEEVRDSFFLRLVAASCPALPTRHGRPKGLVRRANTRQRLPRREDKVIVCVCVYVTVYIYIYVYVFVYS